MATDFTLLTWEEAFREFLIHLEATRARKTHRFYQSQLGGVVRWAEAKGIPFDKFGKRDLDRYLAARLAEKISRTTLRHDAVVAKAFFKRCAKNDFVDRSPRPARYMPSDDEMQQLLAAIQDHWSVARNPVTFPGEGH